MKKKCKNIDVTTTDTVKDWVRDCILRHKQRYDFRDMLFEYGVTKAQYSEALDTHNYSSFNNAFEKITTEACRRIRERKLDLTPVRIREQQDKTTGKVRMIGCEPPMQQIFDYIAVYSCNEIWNGRIVPQQASSVPGRGQVYGVKMLKRYIEADNRAIRYAKKHPEKAGNYSSKCRYVVKLDIKKCYPSADMNIFMKLFEHDCGNDALIWLWSELLKSHKINGYTGFMIGALVSQWACQFMLSFIYREAMSLTYVRRGKKHKCVEHMVMFMDDMALFGSNRKKLREAVEHIIKFTKEKLGFDIKPNYMIHELGQIDMMGYVIYRNGTVSIRARNYIKSRRLKLRYMKRHYLTTDQAKRMVSYKGFYMHSDYNKPGMMPVFKAAQRIISKGEKKKWKEDSMQNSQSVSSICSTGTEAQKQGSGRTSMRKLLRTALSGLQTRFTSLGRFYPRQNLMRISTAIS